MIFRNAFLAKRDMALGTNERGIFLLLIDLVIQSSATIGSGSDMTAVRAATGTHRDLKSFRVQRVHRRHVVTTHAVKVRMLSSFMPESAGGNPLAPLVEHRRVGYSHRVCQLGIEI